MIPLETNSVSVTIVIIEICTFYSPTLIIDYFKAFWTVWTGFLSTKMSLTEEQKKAWQELGKEFADVAHCQLKKLGLPY